MQLINREIISIVWKFGQCIGDFSQQSGKQVFLQVKRAEGKKMEILQEVLSSSAGSGWFSGLKIGGTFHYGETIWGSLRVTDEGRFEDISPSV